MSDCKRCDEAIPTALVYDADACATCGFGSAAHASPCEAFNALTKVREINEALRAQLAGARRAALESCIHAAQEVKHEPYSEAELDDETLHWRRGMARGAHRVEERIRALLDTPARAT